MTYETTYLVTSNYIIKYFFCINCSPVLAASPLDTASLRRPLPGAVVGSNQKPHVSWLNRRLRSFLAEVERGESSDVLIRIFFEPNMGFTWFHAMKLYKATQAYHLKGCLVKRHPEMVYFLKISMWDELHKYPLR